MKNMFKCAIIGMKYGIEMVMESMDYKIPKWVVIIAMICTLPINISIAIVLLIFNPKYVMELGKEALEYEAE